MKDRLIEGKMARESHMVEAMVSGYHVYKEIWCAAVGKELSCIREVENYSDPFAVAVVRSGVIVGHVPRKKLSVCSMFLRRGGTISCRVTGDRRYSATTTNVIDRAACKSRWPCPLLTLFRGFNFRGLPINRENRENWTPRKFPTIRYQAVYPGVLVSA